mmetsp:Transcript_29800/g.48906  ORF Transcript_29800/g.48906 Transcript_29800/m.48906 type:complete len:148 (+) Transcript_29800:236-679(+)
MGQVGIQVKLEGGQNILRRGMKMYPKDHTLLQPDGKIEERLGNVTTARDLYSASLHIEPSAPTLIAYAMLELRRLENKQEHPNVTMARKLFDEELLRKPGLFFKEIWGSLGIELTTPMHSVPRMHRIGAGIVELSQLTPASTGNGPV